MMCLSFVRIEFACSTMGNVSLRPCRGGVMHNGFHVVGVLALAASVSGFDFSKRSIPPEEIRGGGPPKDGIPAILDPQFIPATEATFLEDHDEVIGVVDKGV